MRSFVIKVSHLDNTAETVQKVAVLADDVVCALKKAERTLPGSTQIRVATLASDRSDRRTTGRRAADRA